VHISSRYCERFARVGCPGNDRCPRRALAAFAVAETGEFFRAKQLEADVTAEAPAGYDRIAHIVPHPKKRLDVDKLHFTSLD